MSRHTRAALWSGLLMVLSPWCWAGETIDRVLLTVNSRIILESDLQNEIRLQRLMAGSSLANDVHVERDAALQRLINRALISQEMKGLTLIPESDLQISTQLNELRKQARGADTDEGWHKLLAGAGLTEDDVRERVADEVNTNLFLEAKFRPNLRVSNARIQSYYKDEFVPEMKKRGAVAPPLEKISEKIEQILSEQTLNELFTEWMKVLRNQARIRVLDSSVKLNGFDSPSSLAGMNFLPLRISEEQVAAPAATTPLIAPASAPPR